jgi:hypothetical protein
LRRENCTYVYCFCDIFRNKHCTYVYCFCDIFRNKHCVAWAVMNYCFKVIWFLKGHNHLKPTKRFTSGIQCNLVSAFRACHCMLSCHFTSVTGTNERRHDKTNIMGSRPASIQTSLRIRKVWSGSMLLATSFSTCYRVSKRTAWILIRLRRCAGWPGSMLVANALCWFCYYAAHKCIWLRCTTLSL